MSSDDAMPLPGSDTVRAALQQALEDYGRRLAEDPARLRAVLNDALGSGSADCRAAVDAIVLAAEQGVVGDLVQRRGQAPDPAADAAAATELGRWGLASGTAAWVVATWGTVLRGAGSLPAAADVPLAPSEPQPDELPPTAPPPLAETAPPPALAATAPPPALAATSLPPDSTGDDSAQVQDEPPPRGLLGIRRAVLVPLAVVGCVLALAGTGFATGVLHGSGGTQPPEAHPGASVSPSAESSPTPSPSMAPSPHAAVTRNPSRPVRTTPSPAAVTAPTVTHPPSLAPQVAPAPAIHSPTPTRRRVTTASTAPAPAPATSTQAPPPPPPAAPVAESDTTSYTPLSCGSDWCVASLAPAASGTWDKLTVLGASPSAYATAYANGRKISWQPHRNGYATYDIQWYVTNTSTGKRSATATLSVTMQCNRDYQCN